ncbi:hypothetical protein BJ166DRAFT_533117 [Pestalotiopsis sp. NC0098]|nr:hypothetical protein BJ166DRAFT_533117 [Pestalotiopsis sp. NC0098]
MDRQLTDKWCPSLPSSHPRLLVDAFNEAKVKFGKDLSKDGRKIELVDSKESLEEVREMAAKAMDKYNCSKTHSEAKMWLWKFSSTARLYGDILDVFVQHHPEFVALAWGAMKLLLTAFVNHDKTITRLAKGLSLIADSLPCIDFMSQLYPTDLMKTAIAEVNAYILRFLIRAYDWYREGTWKHVLHSLTRPAELRYDDILEAISQRTARIKDLASYGGQGKMHNMSIKIDEVNTKLEHLQTAMSLQYNSMVSMNAQLTDLQFSQIMESISDSAILMPEKVLSHLQAQAARYQASQPATWKLPQRFFGSSKLRIWTESESSDIVLVKGNFRSRQPLQNFCFDIITQLRESRIHALLAFKIHLQDSDQAVVTCSDVLKYLIRQGLQVTQSLQTESSMSLTCKRFHGNLTDKELFQILEAVVSCINEQVYLVLDLALLNPEFSQPGGFSWLQAFLGFFKNLSARKPTHRVKVLLLNYGPDFPFDLSHEDVMNFVVRAKVVSGSPQQRRPWRPGESRTRGRLRLRGHRGRFSG